MWEVVGCTIHFEAATTHKIQTSNSIFQSTSCSTFRLREVETSTFWRNENYWNRVGVGRGLTGRSECVNIVCFFGVRIHTLSLFFVTEGRTSPTVRSTNTSPTSRYARRLGSNGFNVSSTNWCSFRSTSNSAIFVINLWHSCISSRYCTAGGTAGADSGAPAAGEGVAMVRVWLI